MIVSLKFNQAINEGFDKFFSENKDANISISLSDARRVRDIAYALLGNVSMSGAEGDDLMYAWNTESLANDKLTEFLQCLGFTKITASQ